MTRVSLFCVWCLVASVVGATKYSIDDVFTLCSKELQPEGTTTVFQLDGHIRGPLIDELEAHFVTDNPQYQFRITSEYSDCNQCDKYGCTVMGCDSEYKAWLHVRGRGPITCSGFIREWTLPEMRQRWHRALTHRYEKHTNWPFEQATGEGDVPRVWKKLE